MNEINQYQALKPQLEALLGEMEQLSQPRSNFALRHFVVGQHDLPARQRQQALLELREMLFNLADQVDEIRLTELDIEDEQDSLGNNTVMGTTQRQRVRIKIGQLKRKIEGQRIHLSGRLRECQYLYSLIQSMPKATAADLEAEELEYWSRRLTRQFVLGQRDVGGNLNAMLEMMTEPGQAKPEMDARIENLLSLMNLSEDAVKKLLEEK